MTRSSLVLSLLFFAACKSEHTHDEGAPHSHEGEEHGLELPGQSVTLWTERTELFMEYPPLLVGQETGFAAHLTVLSSFAPLAEGTVTLVVRLQDGSELTGRADAPLRPGIFRPTATPTKPGKCEMTMSIESKALTDRFPVGPCEIFEDDQAAYIELEEEEEAGGRITYLKEQQWKTDFATIEASQRTLQPSVQANGEIRSAAGKEARLTAAISGRIVLADPPPVLGQKIEANQVLAQIAPRLSAGGDRASLEAEVAAARAELEGAEAQLARAERLFADKAIPERNLDEAKTNAKVVRARLSAATARLAQYQAGASGSMSRGPGAFSVRAPFAGSLVKADVTSGEMVEEGTHLFTVIDLDRVWLEARVFEPDIPKIAAARAAWFTIEGTDQPFTVDETNGKLITIGQVIDPATRTIPIVFEVDNRDGRLRIGQFAKVGIFAGEPVKAIAVPESALVDDGGKPTLFVQVEGEAFERRPLTLGVRDQGWVEVKDGLSLGEHAVTVGAYEIKLAAASGTIPAHGHAH